MPVAARIEEVRTLVAELSEASPTAHVFMQKMVKLLHERMLKYNWVGFYMLEPGAQPPMLLLDAFEGAMTPHTRIPLNQGICGAAASSGRTVIVDDVSKDPRYLACSLETKSEIVVPIFVNKKLAAELDIESYFADTFTKSEQEFVEACANVLANHLTRA